MVEVAGFAVEVLLDLDEESDEAVEVVAELSDDEERESVR